MPTTGQLNTRTWFAGAAFMGLSVLGLVQMVGGPSSGPSLGNAMGSSASRPASQVLGEQAAADAGALGAMRDGAWVAQLSSKKPGLVVGGETYSADDVRDDHYAVRAAHPGAVLLWSGDWASYRSGDFWVTVLAREFPDPESANAWCSAQNLDADSCFAKRLSHSSDWKRTTVLRK